MFVDATSASSNFHSNLLMNSNQSPDPDLAQLLAAIAKIPPANAKSSSDPTLSGDNASGSNLATLISGGWQSQTQPQIQGQVQAVPENSSMYQTSGPGTNMSSLLGHSNQALQIPVSSPSQQMQNLTNLGFSDGNAVNSGGQGGWPYPPSAGQNSSSMSKSNIASSAIMSRLLQEHDLRSKNLNGVNANMQRMNNRIGMDSSQLLNSNSLNGNSNGSMNNSMNTPMNGNTSMNGSINPFLHPCSANNSSLNSSLGSPSNDTPIQVRKEISNIISQLLAEQQANGDLGLSITSAANGSGPTRSNQLSNAISNRLPVPNSRPSQPVSMAPSNMNENSKPQAMTHVSSPQSSAHLPLPSAPSSLPLHATLPLPNLQSGSPQIRLAAGSAPSLDANSIYQIVVSTLSKPPKTPEDAIQQQKLLAEIDSLTRDLIEKQIRTGKANGPLQNNSDAANTQVIDSLNGSISSPPALTPISSVPSTNSLPSSVPTPVISTPGTMINHDAMNSNYTQSRAPDCAARSPIGHSGMPPSASISNQSPPMSVPHGENQQWNLDNLIHSNSNMYAHQQNSNFANGNQNLLKRKVISESLDIDLPKRDSTGMESFIGKERIDVDAFVAELLRDSPRVPQTYFNSDSSRRNQMEVNSRNQGHGVYDDPVRHSPMVPVGDDVDSCKPTTTLLSDGPPSKRICAQGPNLYKEEVDETDVDSQKVLNEITKFNGKIEHENSANDHQHHPEDCNDSRTHKSSFQQPSTQQRREAINKRLKELEQLIPGGNTMDPGTLLESVLHHVKQLQLQLQMLNQEEYHSRDGDENR